VRIIVHNITVVGLHLAQHGTVLIIFLLSCRQSS